MIDLHDCIMEIFVQCISKFLKMIHNRHVRKLTRKRIKKRIRCIDNISYSRKKAAPLLENAKQKQTKIKGNEMCPSTVLWHPFCYTLLCRIYRWDLGIRYTTNSCHVITVQPPVELWRTQRLFNSEYFSEAKKWGIQSEYQLAKFLLSTISYFYWPAPPSLLGKTYIHSILPA